MPTKYRGLRELFLVLGAIALYFWTSTTQVVPKTIAQESPTARVGREAATAMAADANRPLPSGYQESDVKDTLYSIRGAELGQNGEQLADKSVRREIPGEQDNDSERRYLGHELTTNDLIAGIDQHSKIGYLLGDSLERGGIPVLAVGNLPAQVEDVLGKPVESGLSKVEPGIYFWFYRFRTFTLKVNFLEGKVHNFLLEANDMAMAGC